MTAKTASTPVFALLALSLVTTGCAGARAVPNASWVPDDAGWTPKEVDDADPPTWVAYHRDAEDADVKEVRVTGLVEAPPAVTFEALRDRMLDPAYAPDDFDFEILEQSDDEAVTYGLSRMPWPFRDREVHERLTFSYDPDTDVHTVEVLSIDWPDAVPRGVIRVPYVRNHITVTPTAWGGSVVTTDSVHDMGGGFPNAWLYAPIRRGMVSLLDDLRTLTE